MNMYRSYQRLSASIRCIRSYSMMNKSIMIDGSNCCSHYKICLNYSTKRGGGGGGGKVTPFKLADIGEGIAEVELMKWFIKEGKLTITPYKPSAQLPDDDDDDAASL